MALTLIRYFLQSFKYRRSWKLHHRAGRKYAATALATLLIIVISLRSPFAQPYEPSAPRNASIGFEQIDYSDGQVRYAYSGDRDKPGVMFIHGTPGGWEAFEVYLENPALQQEFFMVSVDRPGWGGSTLSNNPRLDGSFALQSRGIVSVIESYPSKKWILVGHSLGASLAPQIALDAPESVSALLLLAGSLDPKLGKPRWYNRAASTWLISKLIGKMMLDSNREIMGLRRQLEKMSDSIKNQKLDVKLSLMQGMKDKLVSPKNAAYVDQSWRNNFSSLDIIELANEGHFLPWRQTPLVIETIRKLSE